MTNPLSPPELLSVLRALLPSGYTSITNPATGLALLAHAIHTSLGFRQVKPSPPAVPDGESLSNNAKERNKLPASWLERSSEEESFAISYRHDQSSLLFEVRIARLGGRVVVNAVAVEDDKTATLDITTNDYTSNSAYPITISDDEGFSFEKCFNSPSRLSDYISLYRSQIIQKLIPGLVKPGYTEDNNNSGGNAPPPVAGPSQPRRPGVPYPDPEDDDNRIGAPPRFPQPRFGQNPLEIGRSDLDPLGGAIGRMPGAGGDGMLVGPGHPLFNRENDPLRMPGRGGPWGGDGFLPPLGAPPGARFDPIGPFGGPGQQPRNWGDEMPPPGFDNQPGRGGGGFGAFGPPRGGGAGGNFGNMFM